MNYWFPHSFHFYTWSTQEVIITWHMCCFFETFSFPMFFPLIILTSSHKSWWFPFSFHIWSAIPDFSILPFRCSCSLTFRRQYVSPLYTLAQLHGMEYTQFLVMLYSVGGGGGGADSEMFMKSWATPECCDIIRTTYFLIFFCTHINKGYMKKAGGYSGWNVLT